MSAGSLEVYSGSNLSFPARLLGSLKDQLWAAIRFRPKPTLELDSECAPALVLSDWTGLQTVVIATVLVAYLDEPLPHELLPSARAGMVRIPVHYPYTLQLNALVGDAATLNELWIGHLAAVRVNDKLETATVVAVTGEKDGPRSKGKASSPGAMYLYFFPAGPSALIKKEGKRTTVMPDGSCLYRAQRQGSGATKNGSKSAVEVLLPATAEGRPPPTRSGLRLRQFDSRLLTQADIGRTCFLVSRNSVRAVTVNSLQFYPRLPNELALQLANGRTLALAKGGSTLLAVERGTARQA